MENPGLAHKATNITAVEHIVSPGVRYQRNGHTGAVVWFTGLSASGKSTLAMRLERQLFNKGYQVYVLDGDNVRHGLNSDLGFNPEDRAENIRRIGEVAALFANAGLIVITAFISPYRADRQRARDAAGSAFHEVFIRAGTDTCEARDPKGLYRKARAGLIPEFTGISAPYEVPESPECIIDTAVNDIEACDRLLLDYVESSVALGDTAELTASVR